MLLYNKNNWNNILHLKLLLSLQNTAKQADMNKGNKQLIVS